MTGVPPLHRALASAAAALTLGVALAGCGTSTNAMTAHNYTSADGVRADSGDVGARNLLLVSDLSGATVSGAFANNGTTPDAVTSIAVGNTKASIVAGTGLSIPAAGTMTFGLTGGGPQAFLPGATGSCRGTTCPTALTPGLNVTMTITFEHAAQMVLRVPVLPRSGYYTTVPEPTAGAQSATPSAAGAAAG